MQRMTTLERGIYRELLDEQWKSGALLNDQKWLAEAAMCSEEELATAWRTLADHFPPMQGSGGEFLANERLEVERTAADRKRASNAISGRKGGLAKSKRTPSERHIAVAEQSKALAGEQSERQANASPDGARSLADAVPELNWREMLQRVDGKPPQPLKRLTSDAL